MKKSILYIAILLFTFLQISCEDNKEQYLEDYSTILYFRNSGEVEHTIYKTEEMSQYVVSVVKAGSDQHAVTSVDIKIMDEVMLADYNAAHGTRYKVLPTDCYSIATGNISFNAPDLYKQIDMSLHTTAISKIQEEGNAGDYIVPLYLSDSSDMINEGKKYLFIKPKVETPLVSFEKTGYVMNSFSEIGDSPLELSLPIRLSIENKWSFNCYTGVNEDLLEKYNREQGVNFMLLPTASYALNEGGVVGLKPDVTNSLKVNVNRKSLNYGNYILPLQLTGTSVETIDVDPSGNSCLLGVSYVPDASSLKLIQLLENQISYHPNSICEGSVAGLVDGDLDTYYHSDYNAGVPLPHWLQFALPTESSAFRFEYLTRNAGEHVVPRRISLYGSEDGVVFKKIITLSETLPFDIGKTYTSPVFVVGEKIKSIRMTVDESLSGSFALAEFRLWAL